MMLRLVQYNVRAFKANDGSSNLPQVLETLRALKPDVVCLNEVNLHPPQAGALESLAKDLGGLQVSFFGHAFKNRYGNAILSRFQVARQVHVELEGGSHILLPPPPLHQEQVDSKAETGGQDGKVPAQPPPQPPPQPRKRRIVRGLLVCELEMGQHLPNINVACTHFDHIAKKERKVQAEHVIRVLHREQAERVSSVGGSVLVGDLNALHRGDYTDEEWAKKEAHFKRQGWVGPMDCAEDDGCLAQLAKAGFADCFELSSPSSSSSSSSSSQHKWTSTHIDARIDYVFANRDFVGKVARPIRAWVENDATASDHYPLVVDFETVAPVKSSL